MADFQPVSPQSPGNQVSVSLALIPPVKLKINTIFKISQGLRRPYNFGILYIMAKRFFIILMILGLFLPLPSFAFNPDYIISDQELVDYDSMTADEIQQFFIDHGSFLAYYDAIWPETGLATRAMDIIWQAAQKFQISPKFLLVLLEKEQSLVSIKKPPAQKRLDWAMGYAACDKCWLSHPLVAKYGGFGNQVYYAAERIRNTYLADLEKYGVTHTGMGPGITKKIDKKKVTPANDVTAILYTYTPHITGNKNFFLIWNRWFSSIVYPDGALLQDEKTGGVYLISNGAKRPIISKSILVSRFDEDAIIQVSRRIIDGYPDGPPIKFTDYSLLRDEDQNLYMTVGDEARPFASVEVFRSLGFSPFELEDVTADDLAGYVPGAPITLASAYPTGALLQNKADGGVYWVYDGVKYPIWDKSILAARFSKYTKIKVDQTELNKFATGDPVKFADGTLIKTDSSPAVYFVSGGKLRPIPSEDIFLAYNWKWGNVIKTTNKVMGLYGAGAPVTLEMQIEPDDLAPLIPGQNIQDDPPILNQ